jgi:hypothetical protein
MNRYQIKYRDKFRELETDLLSTGSILNLKLDNMDFEGSSFDTLDTVSLKGNVELDNLEFLFNFEMVVNIPIRIRIRDDIHNGKLTFTVLYGTEFGGNDDYPIVSSWTFTIGNEVYQSSQTEDNFEYLLIHLKNTIPQDMKLECCLSCRKSSYSPYGNCMFGGLICFKDENFKAGKNLGKTEWLNFLRKENKNLQSVQETYYCSDFELMTEIDWNYKDWR